MKTSIWRGPRCWSIGCTSISITTLCYRSNLITEFSFSWINNVSRKRILVNLTSEGVNERVTFAFGYEFRYPECDFSRVFRRRTAVKSQRGNAFGDKLNKKSVLLDGGYESRYPECNFRAAFEKRMAVNLGAAERRSRCDGDLGCSGR